MVRYAQRAMTSQNLLDRLDETVSRLESLEADSPRLWGKMTLPQMLAHCQRPFEVAAGERQAKRGLIGLLLGGFAKRRFIDSDRPFGQNSPTDPTFLSPEADDFEAERAALIDLVRDYGENGPITKEPHPFFGPLTEEDWSRLLWKHTDHHLRQFDV